MQFIGSVFLLASIVCTIFIAIYIGNGLAEGSLSRMAVSLFFLAGAVIFQILSLRIFRRTKSDPSSNEA